MAHLMKFHLLQWEVVNLFIYLFGILRRFQHCTGHIMTGSWKGTGNQYIQFVRVLYCKLPTNSKQLPAFPLEAVQGIKPATVAPWEVVKVKFLMNSDMILTVLNLHQKTDPKVQQDFKGQHDYNKVKGQIKVTP